VAGFSAAVRALVGSPAHARVLLLGAGGAARAALLALLDDGVDTICLLNRTATRAEALRAHVAEQTRTLGQSRGRIEVAPALEALRTETFDLVVNATSLGLRADDPLPLSLDAGTEFAAVLDLVYSPAETAWVREARARGIPAADGLEMLLQQGAAAFERWWGRSAPVAVMRAALGNGL
jgi:shikimate dehydrogenase